VSDRERDVASYLFAAFVTLVFLVLVYYLLQEIPHAERPTLQTVTTVTSSPSSS